MTTGKILHTGERLRG